MADLGRSQSERRSFEDYLKRATAIPSSIASPRNRVPSAHRWVTPMDDSQPLQEKVAFFDALNALDNHNDDDDQIDDTEQQHRNKSRSFFNSTTKKAITSLPDSTTVINAEQQTPERRHSHLLSHPHLRRAASLPTPVAATPQGDSVVIKATPDYRPSAGVIPQTAVTGAGRVLIERSTSFLVEDTPRVIPDSFKAPPPTTLRTSTTMPLPVSSTGADQSPSASTAAARKRKRKSSEKIIPESAQIFRGLQFFYIPNNDIAPARKLRIGKAQEYGAKWIRELPGATHIIVDKNLSYKDIEKIPGFNGFGSLAIVNEDYPLDCLSFRTLLNPDQPRCRVQGFPVSTQDPSSSQSVPASSQISEPSLQVKKPRTSRSRHRNTPHGTQDSSLQNNDQPIPTTSPLPGPQSSFPEVQQRNDSTTVTVVPPPLPDTPHTKDELSDYIELLQKYKDLPLDIEDDDVQSSKDIQEATSNPAEDSVSDEFRSPKRRSRRIPQKTIPFEDRFACNTGGPKDQTAQSGNPNARTIEVLQSMCDYYTRVNDHWRITAYRKAINTLRRQPTKITTQEEAYRLPNIGPRLAAKIAEIVSTNRLRRLEYANEEPTDQVLDTFLKIYGVGLNRANKWISQGCRTLEDLKQKADLTTNQLIGIEHYDDLNTRIPREEVTLLGDYVKREARLLDPEVELLIGGSYRRGSDSSGDIDFIITKKGTTSSADLVPFLETLLTTLFKKGFLVATLAALHKQRPGKDGPGSKWHGCCVLPDRKPRPIWRRIDLLLVPETEYGAALIYFTGNDIFNKSMRLLASKKGMRLNQRGLYREVMRGPGRVKVTEGQLIEGRDEKRIFELLGVKWREPKERWC
ncbi:hypothetical protein QBC35DRAFT_483476 [Podospora australis]|uniref:DNA polymerase lambda n=1 Tax=Podospora australis TaxID=1536484 RepID=A0AAN6X392_9PEZI|nr:hypothetical protein QBC35DRAFT_483476 [Podospora australis]